jgi:xanthine dehydrogenase iron-sulfur cluster and FAD-binding subunit A
MRRKVNDTAILNTAMKVQFEEKSYVIKELVLVFGGLGASIVMATATANALVGR